MAQTDPKEDLIDNILMGDNVKAKQSFQSIMNDKTVDAINGIKQQTAEKVFSSALNTSDETIEEDFDIINNLTNASLRSGGSIHLDTGEEFGVDEESAMVLTTYLKTLTTEEQEGFIATLRRDERGFMKAVEEATYNLSKE